MAHKNKQNDDPTGWNNPNVQAAVPGSIQPQTPAQAAAQDEGPDSQELRDARALMATPKLAVIGGHTGVVYLTDYDLEDGTYSGEFHRNRSMDSSEKLPVVTSVHGLRPYSPGSLYAFQFVECGEDTSVLRNLQRRGQARETPTEVSE